MDIDEVFNFFWKVYFVSVFPFYALLVILYSREDYTATLKLKGLLVTNTNSGELSVSEAQGRKWGSHGPWRKMSSPRLPGAENEFFGLRS